MNTRQELEASLAITPATPGDAVLTMRVLRDRVDLEEALRRAHVAAKQRRWPALRHHLNRAACLFLGIPEEPETMSRIEVREAASETLWAELKKRAADGDKQAQRYTKAKKEAAPHGSR